jgi:hypothetical protein
MLALVTHSYNYRSHYRSRAGCPQLRLTGHELVDERQRLRIGLRHDAGSEWPEEGRGGVREETREEVCNGPPAHDLGKTDNVGVVASCAFASPKRLSSPQARPDPRTNDRNRFKILVDINGSVCAKPR